ncbi:hypothetical protein EJB05_03469, partial [Eragrostis curvula]
LPLQLIGNLLARHRAWQPEPFPGPPSPAAWASHVRAPRRRPRRRGLFDSSNAAHEIHQKRNAAPPWRGGNGHLANSIIAGPPHARWRAMRRLCATELFAPARLSTLRPLREDKAAELVRHVAAKAAAGEPVTVRDPVFTAAMNMLSGALFSVDLESGPEYRELKDTIKEATILAAKPNLSDFFPAIAAADLQGLRRRMAPLIANAHRILDELSVRSRRPAAAVNARALLRGSTPRSAQRRQSAMVSSAIRGEWWAGST